MNKPAVRKSWLTAAPHWAPDLFAGLVSSLVALLYSISCAALVFSGPLAPHLRMGVSSALISAVVVGLIVAWGSAFRFSMAGPDTRAAAIMAPMATVMAARFPPEAAASTMWFALMAGALLTGLFLYVLGSVSGGRLIRFIPYPVIGGFLAGSGWLLVTGALSVMSGERVSVHTAHLLLETGSLPVWVCGALFAVGLLVILQRFRHYLVLPSVILLAVGITYSMLAATGAPLELARERGWFFRSMSGANWLAWSAWPLDQVDVPAVLRQGIALVATALVVAITILLGVTGLELTTSSEVDVDRELRSHGVANVAAALFGGMVGCLAINRAVLHREAGARSPWAAVIACAGCAAVLFFDVPLLQYLPRPVLGGLLLSLGLAALHEWVVRGWTRLSRLDYGVVILIVLIIAVWGFLEGVAVGVIVAAIMFAINYSRIDVVKHALTGAEYRSNVERSVPEQEVLARSGSQTLILWLQGYIFFGTANSLLEQVRRRIRDAMLPPVRFIILNFSQVSGIDSSAALSFRKMKQIAQAANVILIFLHLKPAVRRQLEEGECLMPGDPHTHTLPDLDRALEWCEERLLESAALPPAASGALLEQLSRSVGDAEVAARFMGYLEHLQIPAGHCLFQQGDPADSLFFVESGRLSVWLEPGSGGRSRLRTLGAGTVAGEMGLYRDAPRSATVLADMPSQVYRLSRERLAALQTADAQAASAFHQFIVRLLARRLADANTAFEALLAQSGRPDEVEPARDTPRQNSAGEA
jgi:sulfate permease, SulP family